MKTINLKIALSGIMLLLLGNSLFAQFDDLYYNPETDYVAVESSNREYNQPREVNNQPREANYNEPASSGYNNYDDQYASRMDNYDFHYSSRVRRFNRPMNRGFGFYDPFFVDRYHYDPYYQPGVSIYVNSGWNAFSPWRQRPWGYNRRGFGWGASYGSSWCPNMGYGNSYAFNSMGMGFVRPMGYGMSPWGMNPYGGYGNTMIVNNYYGSGANRFGSDPWAMDNSYNRFSRAQNTDQSTRSVSYGPRTIGSTRGTTTGRGSDSKGGRSSRDGLNPGQSNYDRYPGARRQSRSSGGTTGLSDSDQRNTESARRTSGRQDASSSAGREANGRSSEATRSNPQQNVRGQSRQTRRSLFNNSSRSRNSRSTSPRTNRSSRSSGVNRSSRRSSRSSGINRSSRSSRSSGVNRSSRSSRSSGVNRSSRSSRSSGVNRSSRSSSSSSSGSRRSSSRGGGRG